MTVVVAIVVGVDYSHVSFKERLLAELIIIVVVSIIILLLLQLTNKTNVVYFVTIRNLIQWSVTLSMVIILIILL